MNILLIEDDRRIADLVRRCLHEDGHTVAVTHNGTEGAELLLAGSYDAALLDILLPGMNGLDVLEKVRAQRCATPILMLTAVDTVPKILEAFDLGADDYLVKPFLLEILLARVKAISRRTQKNQPDLLQAGNLVLDRRKRIAICENRQIVLTRKQVDLLELLMSRKGLVTSREDLIEAGWGRDAEVKENTLDVYIHNLRNKLHDHSETHPRIRTIHGAGYLFAED